MSFRLSEAKLEVARLISRVVDSEAVSGNTHTLYDNNFPYWIDEHQSVPQDDHYNGGTVFMRTGANSHQARMIYDWSAAASKTGQIECEAFSSSITAGDKYSIVEPFYPNWLLERAVNDAYRDLGSLPQYNYALSTVANQEEYSLPSGVYNVLRVEAADMTATTDSTREWRRNFHWDEISGKIRLFAGFRYTNSGRSIRITYQTRATELSGDTNTFSDHVHPDVIVYGAARRVLHEKYAHGGKLDRSEVPEFLNEMRQKERDAIRAHPIPRIKKDPKLSNWMLE